jgi:hypothetical protein
VTTAWSLSLPRTADQSRGSSNLATMPRAGNISTDMRAGTAACSGPSSACLALRPITMII